MTPWVVFLIVVGISLVSWAVSRFVRRGGNRGGTGSAGLVDLPASAGRSTGYSRSAPPAGTAWQEAVPQTVPQTVPQVKMMLVGAKESGRTMQLLAMHHRMSGEPPLSVRKNKSLRVNRSPCRARSTRSTALAAAASL
jgi:hypothetical protein